MFDLILKTNSLLAGMMMRQVYMRGGLEWPRSSPCASRPNASRNFEAAMMKHVAELHKMLDPKHTHLILVRYLREWCIFLQQYCIHMDIGKLQWFFLHNYIHFSLDTVGPLMIESPWGKTLVSTGPLQAADNLSVVIRVAERIVESPNATSIVCICLSSPVHLPSARRKIKLCWFNITIPILHA